MKKSNSLSDKVFDMCNMIFLVLILVLVAYPCIFVVSSSLSDASAVSAGEVWLWPIRPTLLGYETAFKSEELVRGFLNSIIVTFSGTLISVLLTVLLAYPLARKTFYGRNGITIFMMITMFFGGGLIPTFLLINSLGMYNTYWALILPGAVGITNTIICRTFFQNNIPSELYEAGELDGCSDFSFFIKVAFPLSAPIIAVLVMYYAVGHWNLYFNAMIYLQDRDLFTLQVVLREILIRSQLSETMMDVVADSTMQGVADLLKYSTIVVSSVPMLIVYPFVQKHFVKGVMIGSIKG